MDEFALIRHYFTRQTCHSALRLGIGDDCAVVDVPEGSELVFSMDSLVADRHFFADAAPFDIAQRALGVCLSDLAAMGASPLCFTLALSIPEQDKTWLQGFSQGLFSVADAYHCELVGGDTVRGPLLISIQVHGCVPKGQAILRSGAKAGDLVVVSGNLGDAAAALAVLKGEKTVPDEAAQYFERAYYQPQPRIRLGQLLRPFASAAIDISDGFLADLGHICQASGVAADIQIEHLPISDSMKSHFSKEEYLAHALSGGDDYQLCLCISEDLQESFADLVQRQQLDLTVVGRIKDGEGVRCLYEGREFVPLAQGYTHF